MNALHFGTMTVLLTACGVQGEKGRANFDVGSQWENDKAVALGSVFEVDVNGGLFSGPMSVMSNDETIFSSLENGKYHAAAEGEAAFLAVDEDGIVELTGLIAFQNMSSKFNSALDIPPQGFCKSPGGA